MAPQRHHPNGGRPTRAVLAAVLTWTAAGPLHAQAAHRGTPWPWLEAYYEEYSAMSAAPLGPAMDQWLARYAPFVFFEDPTLGQQGTGHDPIRKAYTQGFTGPLGPVRWHILRRAASGDWAAVAGWLEGTRLGKPFRTQFSSWLKLRDGRIVHQIDYVDYVAMRRQSAGEIPVPELADRPAGAPGPGDPARALRVADEYYRRYDAMSMQGSDEGIARYTALLTEDFVLEDPTAGQRVAGRERIQAMLRRLLATGDYGAFHWEIDRQATDGVWVAVEGTWRAILRGRPVAARFTTWLRVQGDQIAHQVDYVDYAPLRPPGSPQ